MRTLVIIGHPNPNSFCHALAQQYIDAGRTSGAEIRVLDLSTLRFDPSLRNGFQGAQDLESELQEAQALLKWCSHLCLIYPVWWGSTPAVLKGFFDRVLLPGFAFKYRPSGLPDKLLAGRSARLIGTSDSPTWYLKWMMRDAAIHSVKHSTLAFCGFKVRVSRVDNVRQSSPGKRTQWLNRMTSVALQDHRH